MDKRNINVLVQSIKRSLHLIYKNRFQLNNRNSNKFGLKCSYFRANECIFALLVHASDWVFFRNEQQKVYYYWSPQATLDLPSHLLPNTQTHAISSPSEKKLKTESIWNLGNFNFQWTKTLYQKNLNNAAFFYIFQGL